MTMNKIYQELNACAAVCNICNSASLSEGNVTALARCIELTRECAELCQLTASLLTRHSANTDKFLRLCSEVCEVCAEECEKHDHQHCQRCAGVCHRCSEMCLLEQIQ